MSTIAVPEPVQDLIDRGLVDIGDVQAAFTARSTFTPVYSTLGEDEKSQLLSGSGLDTAGQARVRRDWSSPERAAVRRWARQSEDDIALLGSSATVQQLAEDLAVNPSTITRWHAKGAVVGFTDAEGRLRLPRWQFTPTGLLPGWAQIAPQAAGLPVTMLAALMHARQDELSGQTPVEWLADGGAPAVVADLVGGLRRW